MQNIEFLDVIEETEKTQIEVINNSMRAVEQISMKLQQQGLSHCEECGIEIPKERLQVYPSARTCVPCQEYLEKFFAPR